MESKKREKNSIFSFNENVFVSFNLFNCILQNFQVKW